MTAPIVATLAFQNPRTAEALEAVAHKLGLVLTSIDVNTTALDSSNCSLFLLEQHDTPEAFIPRVFSITGANPDLLVVVIVPHPRECLENGLLTAGAFDVIDDGLEMESQLARALGSARRVIALQHERARLAADLAQQDKLSALGLLAAGVSHEINNPCTAILANVTSVRESLESVLARPRFQRIDALDSQASDWLEAMGDCIGAAKRITSIVKTLNVFSRRTDDASPVAIDVNDEITTVMRLIGTEVRIQARFDLSLAPHLPRILMPPNSMTQILTNLVVNALQALEGQVRERRIWISTRHDEEFVMVEVSDNGPGIPADLLGRIFDPFFTTKPLGKGTGLGLAITKQLVQRARGEIFAESEAGEGARFRLVFEVPTVAEIAPSRRSTMPPASDRLRVLILDDDEVTLRSIQRSLTSHFECITLTNGADALDSLRQDNNVDVVLSDIVMPEMNGLQFYERLLHDQPQLATRTVFLTGGVTSEHLQAGVNATGRPLLGKPVDFAELIRTIRTLGGSVQDMNRWGTLGTPL